MLQPLDEPDDRYGLNDHWPQDYLFMIASTFIPFVGLGVAIGNLSYYLSRGGRNPYNLPECSRKTALFGLAVQALYALIAVVMFA